MASIYLVPIDGSADPQKLTPDDLYETAPAWLPDGSGLAYAAQSDNWEIRQYDIASGTVRTVTEIPSNYMVTDVYVSPDQGWIAYSMFGPLSLSRVIKVVNVADPTVILTVPHDGTWSDRLMGWAPGV